MSTPSVLRCNSTGPDRDLRKCTPFFFLRDNCCRQKKVALAIEPKSTEVNRCLLKKCPRTARFWSSLLPHFQDSHTHRGRLPATGENAKAGDRLSLRFDPEEDPKLQRGFLPPEDAVTLAVSFDSLPDGTNYPKETVVDAKAKQIQVKMSNSGYKK